VLDADRAQELDDEIRPVSCRAAVLQSGRHNGQRPVGEAAASALRKSASVKPYRCALLEDLRGDLAGTFS